jgi:hypothetical protein
MGVSEVLQQAQFLVDAEGVKKAVVFDYSLWEELLTLLEDLEDAEEIRRLREAGEDKEALPWEQSKEELRPLSAR